MSEREEKGGKVSNGLFSFNTEYNRPIEETCSSSTAETDSYQLKHIEPLLIYIFSPAVPVAILEKKRKDRSAI